MMHFHFMRYFVNNIISRVSNRLLYCVFIEVDFENRKCYSYFFKKSVNSEHKTQHTVITHANTFNGIKIPTFFWKKLGDQKKVGGDVILVQCPFNWHGILLDIIHT